jgi:2-oxoisovalerate dehydrogenase E1 component
MKKQDILNFKKELLSVFKIRLIENSLINLFKEGLISGTVHTCVGQEYTGVFIAKYLKSKDYMFSNHRGHGHYLSHTNDINGLLSELMSRKTGCSGGYGGSQHLKNDCFLSNGIQGGLLSVASGYAFSQSKFDLGHIAVIFIGDGTLGEGALYESMNIMALFNTPVLIVLEDNEIAQSNPSLNSISGSIKLRPNTFGIKYFHSDIWDLNDLDVNCKMAVDYVRNESKPAFLHIKCARLNAHSKGDDNRSDSLINELVSNDILNVAVNENVINKSEINDIEKVVEKSINNSKLENKLEFVNKFHFIIDEHKDIMALYDNDRRTTQADDINDALDDFLRKNEYGILIGEDIEDLPLGTTKQYGGAFKITKGLSTKHPSRVINFPISEYTIAGFSIGYALNKMPIIAEIMFGDFTTLVVDQIIQNASKFKIMYGVEIDLPILLRTPMGGRRGYGPTHSQSLEKLFLGFQGIRVLAINPFSNPKKIFECVFKEEFRSPTILIENKILYTLKYPELPSYYTRKITIEDFPNNIIKPKHGASHVVIFCYGYSVITALEVIKLLFLEYEICCDVIFPEKISPLNLSSFNDVLLNKKMLVCIEEGLEYGSVSAQFISHLSQKRLLPGIVKVFGNNTIIPASQIAEEALMPSINEIVEFVNNNL